MEYRTRETISFFGGKIGLSAAQASIRMSCLKPVKVKKGAGIFEIVGPVQFKAGEVIELDKPDKATLTKLESMEEETVGDEIASPAGEKTSPAVNPEDAPPAGNAGVGSEGGADETP